MKCTQKGQRFALFCDCNKAASLCTAGALWLLNADTSLNGDTYIMQLNRSPWNYWAEMM